MREDHQQCHHIHYRRAQCFSLSQRQKTSLLGFRSRTKSAPDLFLVPLLPLLYSVFSVSSLLRPYLRQILNIRAAQCTMNLGSSSFVGIRPLATACLESLPVELLHLIVDRVAHLDYVDNQIRGCAIRTLQSQDHETEGSIPPCATAITRLCLVNSTFAAICQPFIWTVG